MVLKNVGKERFKEVIYPEYKKIFPKEERKSYKVLENLIKNNVSNIIEIEVENKFVGFMIVNALKNNPYAQLDYFAILPEYQRKGYGNQALKLLQQNYEDYNGIILEVEKIGLGKDEKENEIRRKRIAFYERIGCIKMGFEINLFQVIFSVYMLPCLKENFSNEEIIEKISEIYTTILGKERVKRDFKIILK